MALRSKATTSAPGSGSSTVGASGADVSDAEQSQAGRGRPRFSASGDGPHSVVIDSSMARRYMAEFVGTALLVFFGAGIFTISFGFRAFGGSVAAGILLTGLTFGLVMTGLIAVIGPISGSHVNPAVSLGAYLARRMSLLDLAGYWIAQLVGGLLGALLLLWVMHTSPFYTRSRIGLGATGYDRLSLLHASGGGAFLIEIILTAVFVLVFMSATRRVASAPIAGVIIGFALALVTIMGIAVDGASVNPARSFGPAVVVGGLALSQLWLFLIAPLVGAVFGAGLFIVFHPGAQGVAGIGAGDLPAEHTLTMSAADEGELRAAAATTAPIPPVTTGAAPGTAVPGRAPAGGKPQARPGRERGLVPERQRHQVQERHRAHQGRLERDDQGNGRAPGRSPVLAVLAPRVRGPASAAGFGASAGRGRVRVARKAAAPVPAGPVPADRAGADRVPVDLVLVDLVLADPAAAGQVVVRLAAARVDRLAAAEDQGLRQAAGRVRQAADHREAPRQAADPVRQAAPRHAAAPVRQAAVRQAAVRSARQPVKSPARQAAPLVAKAARPVPGSLATATARLRSGNGTAEGRTGCHVSWLR